MKIFAAIIIALLLYAYALPREPQWKAIAWIPTEEPLRFEEAPDWVETEIVDVVAVTIYHAVEGQTDSTPNITADGTKFDISRAGSYRFCALSRDLLSRWGGRYSYGDTVTIEGAGHLSGKWIVRDSMNARFKRKIDLLVDVDTKAVEGYVSMRSM